MNDKLILTEDDIYHSQLLFRQAGNAHQSQWLKKQPDPPGQGDDVPCEKCGTVANDVLRPALQQAILALEELDGPGYLIGGVMHYRIGLLLPKLNEALASLASPPPAPPPTPQGDEKDWTEVDLWAEIYRLRAAVKGPEGYDSWQDAATAERIRLVKAEAAQAEPSTEGRAESFIQAAISNAPDPLRKLGEFLTRVLDEDQWPTAERFLLAIAAQSTQAEPVLPNNEHVICPGCAHQFRAIPVQVQQLLLSAGHEPPFLAAQPPREPVQPLSDEDMANCGLLSELRLEEERRAEWHAEMRRDAFGDKT